MPSIINTTTHTTISDIFPEAITHNLEKSQRIYLINNRCVSSSNVPCQIRQKLYSLSTNLYSYVLDENILNVLEGEIERMFAGVDDLEKIIYKLDIHTASINNVGPGATTNEDELEDIYQSIVGIIRKMEENMDRFEKIMLKA
ncbi:8366_t:CDS:2 [Cetraspora pellucida]|uniref:8366_t:CDS:1 n=1 Tax=Cetraspora pellucida TaxID=1433469 RepID=A0A9N9ISP8_9GLOM|nr:8366_t:CDS:2 [Cetraspora pellucida]